MKNGLKKEDSALLYGLTILMMMYHHLFATPGRLGSTDYFSVLNTVFGGITEQRVAWLFRIGLMFFAFISGYGLCSILSKQTPEERCSFASIFKNYKLSLKQLFKLMKKYWLVYVIFIPMGFVFLRFSYISPRQLIMSLLGLEIFYCGEWWYITQFIFMMLLFPIFDFVICNIYSFVKHKIIERFTHGNKIVIGFVVLLGALFAVFRNAPIFYYFLCMLDNDKLVVVGIFFVGHICRFFRLFEFGADNNTFQKLRPFIAIVLLGGCLGIRWIRAYNSVYCKYDLFITAPVIYGLCTLFGYTKRLSAWLGKLGKHSTYMWLTHAFFCFYYFNFVILAAKVSTLMFLLLTVLSLVTAILFSHLENGLTKLFRLCRRKK